MRKFITIIFAVLVLVPLVAQAEFAVPSTQSYTPSTGIDQKILNKLAQQGAAQKKAMNEVAKLAEKSATERNEALNAIASSTRLNAETNGKVVEALGSYGKKTEAVEKAVTAGTKNLSDQASNYAALVVIVVVLLAILVIVANRISARRSRQENAEQLRPVVDNGNHFVTRMDTMNDSLNDLRETVVSHSDELLTEIRNGFEEMRTGFADLPVRTAAAIQTLDASSFEFEAAGHQVTYTSPAEGIAEGYYLLLHVPKDEKGDPATYDRAHETNRGVARRNCRKTMQKYFEGDFKAPEYILQRELIGYLISTGELSYRKIS